MTQIKKYEQLTPEFKQALEEHGMAELRVGDTFILVDSNYCEIIRVIGFEKDEDGDIMVQYQAAKDFEATEWGRRYYDKPNEHDTATLKGFKKDWVERAHQLERGKSIAQYFVEAKDVISGKISMDVYRMQNTGEISEERALIHKGSKEMLKTMQADLERKQQEVEVIANFVRWEMECRRRELDKIKTQLYEIVADFQKKITRIMRVITTIELYLGINEELFQLQDGPRAATTEPIQFRQALLYMDEEIGHWQDGGLDYTNIDWFDNWLVQNNNFKKLLPEPKGMVVFRPRRHAKDYTDDWFVNAMKNKENLDKTYLLIRNGECLFRIFTDNIVILPRLFPKRKELEQLLAETAKEIEKERGTYWEEKAREKVDDIFYHYKMRAALMQGLIDRSEVFTPMATKISIYKPDESNLVKFIYDDEETLPDGRKRFWDWVKDINSKITFGSRVVITGQFGYCRDDYIDRFYRYYRECNVPRTPGRGVYSVLEKKKDQREWCNKERMEELKKQWPVDFKILATDPEHYPKGGNSRSSWLRTHEEHIAAGGTYEIGYNVEYIELHMIIRYNPKDDVRHGWSWETFERKNNLSFRIFKTDEFVLNYDQIDLDDVNFYLISRPDRHNYLEMMPVLESIREQRLKEIDNEKAFIRFVVGRVAPQLDDNKAEALKRTLECIRWWKYKNKWKRPIAKDDTLALRMIEKRLLSDRYQFFKHYQNRE